MARNLLVVESPAKARTIKKYLGPDYEVLASYGHVRDLIPKDGAVEPENGFAMHYEPIARNAKHVNALSRAMKKATALYLATDPDREGEAISWHVAELLRGANVLDAKPVHRVVFHEITKRAINEAMASPREISTALVNAQQARRALDYLVGFNLSPLLWKKIRRGLSAGRVQSPALRMIVEREEEIERFEKREYWSIEADLENGGVEFAAKLARLEGVKIEQFSITDEAHAERARARVAGLCSPGGAAPALEARGHAERLGTGGQSVRAQRREEAAETEPRRAVHYLDASAGGGQKARLHREPDDAGRPAALRGCRCRGWRGRPHHLHAYRFDHPRGRGGDGDSRVHRENVRFRQRAARAACLSHARKKCAGGARGDPADLRRAHPGITRQGAGERPGEALRTGLETHGRLSDAARDDRYRRRGVHVRRRSPARHARPRRSSSRHRVDRGNPGFSRCLRRKCRRQEGREGAASAGSEAGRGNRSEGAATGAALHRASTPLLRGEPDTRAGRLRNRPSFDLCGDYFDASATGVRRVGETPLPADRRRPAGQCVRDRAFCRLRGLRIHRSSGRRSRCSVAR